MYDLLNKCSNYTSFICMTYRKDLKNIIMINIEISDGYRIPMKVIEDIAKSFNTKVISGIDVDYNVYVYIDEICLCLAHTSCLSDATGRGETYEKACISLINKLLNKKYNIRYKNSLYATERVRNIIQKSNICEYYMLF